MPNLSSTYHHAPFYLRSGHWETIFPAITRWIPGVRYKRERLELSDGDFVDLDWLKNRNKQLVILVHGLEGNTTRHYMKGMAKYFHQRQWDVLAMNCRSCSEDMNRKLRLYNHGEIGDLEEVIQHAVGLGEYKKVALVGFSMGGSIILKYLGERADHLPPALHRAAVFSVPTDLHGSVAKLDTPELAFYRKRFHQMLADKISRKAAQFPNQIDLSHIHAFDQWRDFDDRYSAPINGYRDAHDFYSQGSANHFIPNISIPTLLVNAMNDPILSPSCFPSNLANAHSKFYLEITDRGGHVGFSWMGKRYAWSEWRAFKFVNE